MARIAWLLFVCNLVSSLQLQTKSLARRGPAISSLAAAATPGGSPVRELGGYERLLGRRSPGTDALSLSHAAVFLLTGAVDDASVVAAAAVAMARHPMLRAGIRRDTTTSQEAWVLCDRPAQVLAREAVQTRQDIVDLDAAWKHEFNSALNGPSFAPDGPQWRLLNLAGAGGGASAWVFCVNHAADDQQSLNIVVAEMLAHITRSGSGSGSGSGRGRGRGRGSGSGRGQEAL